MKKSIHALTMEEAFRNSGRRDYARESEEVPEHLREQQELDAAREWLAHVEKGRIGGS
jgi:hypothetical protein